MPMADEQHLQTKTLKHNNNNNNNNNNVFFGRF
jgi:hypothetical protein